MPALHLCGKPSMIAGDDVRCCIVWYYLLRLLQIACVLPLIVYSLKEKIKGGVEYDDVCPEDEEEPLLKKDDFGLFYSYLWLSLAYTILMMSLESGIWVVSGWGTPTMDKRRSPVLQKMLYGKYVLLLVVKLGLTTYGGIIARSATDYCRCGKDNQITSQCRDDTPWLMLLRILVISQFSDSCAAVTAVVYVIWLHARSIQRRLLSGICCTRQACIKWFVCCCCSCTTYITCCCTGGGDAPLQGDFATLAVLLEDYLGGPVDVVLTDVLVAFRMLRRVQMERRLESQRAMLNLKRQPCNIEATDEGILCDERQEIELQLHMERGQTPIIRRESITKPVFVRVRSTVKNNMVKRSLLSKRHRDDLMAVAEGARFMRVSLAIYSWLMQITHNPCKECCCVLCTGTVSRFATCQCLQSNDRIIGDNRCGWNEASVRNRAGLDDAELVYAQFNVGVEKTPYCIVLDHEWRSVVLVIRGTLSLDDLMADLMVQPTSLDDLGNRCGFDGSHSFAHKGVLECAVWVYDDLMRHGKLHELLLDKDSRYKDYKLRVAGHSLGAGCASLVALFLRSRHPDLRCLCFCPPGATMSKDLAEACRDYLTSYVLDSDFVPRLSLNALENLRDDVLEMVARIKVSKYEANRSSKGSTDNNFAEASRHLLHNSCDLPESDYKEQLAKFHKDQNSRKTEREIEDVELFPPGKIVHLVQTGQNGTGPKHLCRRIASVFTCGIVESPLKKQYSPLWADVADFQEIELNTHFLDDHDPENVLRELEATATGFGLSPPYLPRK